MIPPIPGDSAQIKLINACSRGLEEMNTDTIGRYLHKDFHHVILPKSLGVPALDKEASLKRLLDVDGVGITGYGLTLHSVVEAPGKAVIHGSLDVENPYGLNTKYEAMYIIHFVTDDDGSLKIIRSDEFADSKVYSDVHQALAVAKAGK